MTLMTRISPYADDNAKFNEERTFNDAAPTTSDDPFYSEENIAELKRRLPNYRSGKSIPKEHELIEP